jgi:hypothetical protein
MSGRKRQAVAGSIQRMGMLAPPVRASWRYSKAASSAMRRAKRLIIQSWPKKMRAKTTAIRITAVRMRFIGRL